MIEMTRAKLLLLKSAYRKAVEEKASSFPFDGIVMTPEWAAGVIASAETKFKEMSDAQNHQPVSE